MDPDENLARQHQIANDVIRGTIRSSGEMRGLCEELCDLIEALDDWLRKGGALPERWRKP